MTQFKMPLLNTPLLLPVLLLLLLLLACIICCYISTDNTTEGFAQNVDIETILIIKKDLKSEEYKKYIGNEKVLISDIKDGVITKLKLMEFMKSIGEIPTSGYKKTTKPWKKQIGQETGTICYKPTGIMWGAANGPSTYDQIFYLDNSSWKMMPHSKLSDSISKLISLYTTPDGKCKTLKSGQSVTVNGIELLCNNDKLVIKITPQAYKPTVEECKDNNVSCEAWAKSGQCKKNPGYMLVNCKKSCKTCDSPGMPSSNIPVPINNKFVSVIRNDRNGYNCGNTSYEGNEKVNMYISSITNYCNKLINTYETLNKEPSTVIVENKIAVPEDMSQQEKYKLNKLKESILQNQIDILEKEAPFKNIVDDKKNQLIETKKTTAKILQQIESGIETINTLSSITYTVSIYLYDGITVEDYNSTFYNDNLLIVMTGGNNVGVINKLKTVDLTKLTNKINVDETSIFSEKNKKAILEVLNQYKIEVVEIKQKDAEKRDAIKKESSVLTDLNINNINLKGLQNIANALAVKDKTLANDINPIKYNETELRKYLKKYLAKNHSNKKDVTEYFNANIFK